MVVSAFSFADQNPATPKITADTFYRYIHSDYLTIKSFGWISVSFEGDDAKKIGLNENQLTDFAKLKFKNNFSDIQYTDRSNNLAEVLTDDKSAATVGLINIRVWIVGDDYPIAYHVAIQAGGLKNPSYKNAYLGFGSKRNVPDTVKKAIEEFIEEFAVDFFKVRKEI
jgi:hypothetical protein